MVTQTRKASSLPLPDFAPPARPFLKWAGGKNQLLEQYEQLFPAEIRNGGIEQYAEPFLGGGATFFYIAQKYPVKRFYLSDINSELIRAYRAVQLHVEDLIDELAEIEEHYWAWNSERQAEFFYAMRTSYNRERALAFSVTQAARIIFLNRTCFNGLFRLNSKGEFNVPFGDYPRPTICDASNLRAGSQLLQRAELAEADFATSEVVSTPNTFFYFDPPYRPISKTASFTTYAGHEFGDASQKRLAEFCQRLHEQNCKWMVSNSDPKNHTPHDDFFEQLYSNFRIRRVKAIRAINANGARRGAINELVITNY